MTNEGEKFSEIIRGYTDEKKYYEKDLEVAVKKCLHSMEPEEIMERIKTIIDSNCTTDSE